MLSSVYSCFAAQVGFGFPPVPVTTPFVFRNPARPPYPFLTPRRCTSTTQIKYYEYLLHNTRPRTRMHYCCCVGFQSLQKQMAALRSENRALKGILTDKLGDRSKQAIYDCTTELSRQVVAGRIGEDDEETVAADMAVAEGGDAGGGRSSDGGGGKVARRDLSRPDYRLMKSLQTVRSKTRKRLLPGVAAATKTAIACVPAFVRVLVAL